VFTARVLGIEVGVARAVLAISMAVVIGLVMAFLYQKEDSNPQPQSKVYAESEDREYKKWLFFVDLVLILVIGASPLRGVVKWPVIMGLLAVLVYVVVKWQDRSETRLWMSETWQLSKLIVPYLLVGVFAAGIIKQGLPPAYVSRFVGGNSVAANVTASVAGALMYFATLTEVPIVDSLMSLGMGKGPELALLLAGPALSLPNMLAIRQVLGTQKTLTYVGLVILFATLSGIVYGGI
jgi:uncharacterized membrane protein YraQ (UPF0718 family)